MSHWLLLILQYRREFADPFWNSQEQNMLTYIFMLMTSWAIVCDVYYLEPTVIGVSSCCRKFQCKALFFLLIFQENETAIEFAARVKADICKKGGLVDLPWQVFNHATIHAYILYTMGFQLHMRSGPNAVIKYNMYGTGMG